jgi:hypothetical protein
MGASVSQIIFISGIRECAAKISTLYIPSAHRLHVLGRKGSLRGAGHLLAARRITLITKTERRSHRDALLMGRAAKRSKQVHYRIILRIIRHAALTSERFQIPEC